MYPLGQQATLFLNRSANWLNGGRHLLSTPFPHPGQFVKLEIAADAFLAKIDANHFDLLRFAAQNVEVLRIAIKFAKILLHLLFVTGRDAQNLGNLCNTRI